MLNLLRSVTLLCLLAAVVSAAEPAARFSETLTAEQKQRLGLAQMTPAQITALDAAVAAFSRGETNVAVQQAVQKAEQQSQERLQVAEKKAAVAADTAVAEYKKKQEPGVVARALDVFRRRQEEDSREKFTARIVGEFRGWHGGTYFPLENGQVWRQVGSETNEMPPVQNAEVEIYKSNSGYWRMKYGGAWISVKRLQ